MSDARIESDEIPDDLGRTFVAVINAMAEMASIHDHKTAGGSPRMEIAPMNINDLPKHTPYFGGCPTCWRTDGCRNIGREHYFFCEAHKKVWCVGSNLFSSWRDENEEIWERNLRLLADFEPCEEVMCLEPEMDGYVNDVAMGIPGVAERQLRALQTYAREQAMKPRPPQPAVDDDDIGF